MIGLLNNLISVIALFGGFVAFMVTLTVVGMLWSGKITLPGTDARRVPGTMMVSVHDNDRR